MDKKKVLTADGVEKPKKVTYDSLLTADTVTKKEKKDNFSKMMIIKYIAVTVILFAIIFGSLLLFRRV